MNETLLFAHRGNIPDLLAKVMGIDFPKIGSEKLSDSLAPYCLAVLLGLQRAYKLGGPTSQLHTSDGLCAARQLKLKLLKFEQDLEQGVSPAMLIARTDFEGAIIALGEASKPMADDDTEVQKYRPALVAEVTRIKKILERVDERLRAIEKKAFDHRIDAMRTRLLFAGVELPFWLAHS